MSIRRGPRHYPEHYTIIANGLVRDERLSFKARGIAVWLLSHVEGYQATAASIARAAGCGVDQVNAGLRELEQHGYLTREQSRDDQGRVGPVEYMITDEPGKGLPVEGKPNNGSDQRKQDVSPGGDRNGVSRERITPTHKNTKGLEDQPTQEDQTPLADAAASTETAPPPEPDGSLFGPPAASERVVPISQKADAGFERWWKIYPRREGKKAARASFDKALRVTDVDGLCAGAERYARHVQFVDRRYVKQPMTWLNQGCWDDELGETPRAAAGGGNRIRDFKSPALADQGAYDESW